MTPSRILTAALVGSALTLSACQKTDGAAGAADAYVNDPSIPAECNAYLASYHACVTKLSRSNPQVAAQMRTQLEEVRAGWKKIEAQEALAQACKQVDEGFRASSAAMGC